MIGLFKSKSYTTSAYISLTLLESLEIDDKKIILKRIEKILNSHTNYMSETKTYKVSDSLSITFTPTIKKSSIYIYKECNDDFFWIIHELHRSIQLAVDEKDKKIEQNFNLYDKWWLILVDSITYGMDSEDFKQLKNIKLNKRKFAKVIILSAKGNLKVLKY